VTWIRNHWFAWAAAAGVVAAAVALYLIPPGEGTFYPRCWFFAATGLHCPGCGATRCIAALLHGDLRQAAAYNIVLVLVLPFLILAGILAWIEAVTGRRLLHWRVPPWAIRVLIVILAVFWVLRNIPIYPFNLLAPHTL
jgi:hypothetical protein